MNKLSAGDESASDKNRITEAAKIRPSAINIIKAGASLTEYVAYARSRLPFEVETVQALRVLLLTASPFEMWDALSVTVGYDNGDRLNVDNIGVMSQRYDELAGEFRAGSAE
ncbi:hypothetical protein GCM10011591_05970 [Nocardia camponoti]|uniref:Uncharacterized protein n=2 Tax=Nocardia camponoti TaxID=1616106 RepID=A0A917QAR3_9NOCA|nr:hypothetical protein GCM10011591_05970 [Nocardia camponoti]